MRLIFGLLVVFFSCLAFASDETPLAQSHNANGHPTKPKYGEYPIDLSKRMVELESGAQDKTLLPIATLQKQITDFAKDVKGLGMSDDAAKTFSMQIVARGQPTAGLQFSLLEVAYAYARDTKKLNLPKKDARAWATKIASDPKGVEKLVLHMVAFKDAWESDSGDKGMGMSRKPAAQFADRLIEEKAPYATLAAFKNAYNAAYLAAKNNPKISNAPLHAREAAEKATGFSYYK